MSATWNTKYGTRRVRHDPPTLTEAIAAAQGLTDDLAGQVQIAAELMGLPAADVKAEIQKLTPDRRMTRIVTAPSRDNVVRTIVVERKASRRIIARTEGFVAGPVDRQQDRPRSPIPTITLAHPPSGRRESLKRAST